jgi:hypothetical protein
MNERLALMLGAMAIRDAVVIRLFGVAAVWLLSAWLLQVSQYPARLKRTLIQVYGGLCLVSWTTLLVVLVLAGRTS